MKMNSCWVNYKEAVIQNWIVISNKVKEVLDLSNFATKIELEDATDTDTSNLILKRGFIGVKAQIDELQSWS